MRTKTATVPLIWIALLSPLLAAVAGAAPQDETHQVHREVVVVGAEPGQHRMLLDSLAHRAYLGVHLLNLTPELRQHFGAPRESGVLVSRVPSDGPAAAAGVLVGDVITAVDDQPVSSTSQLVGRIGSRHKGDEVVLALVRDRTAIELRATLEESERRQLEVGQFVWRGGEGGPVVLDLGPEGAQGVIGLEPGEIERFIAVDPEAINESVSRLLERIQDGGGAGGLRLDAERREQLEKRIAELEERLRAMEREIRRQRDPSGD